MRLLTLLSGGIDSPVAVYMMAETGAEMLALHMDGRPYSDAMNRIEKIVERLRIVTKQDIPLYSCPHGEVNLSEIGRSKNPHIRCILCKRSMMRVAERVAESLDCEGIVMGDSAGQVASQTLKNMQVEQEAIAMPIIRPLIGLDKLEIIDIAREIGTYELSIEDAGACQIAPKKPSTRAQLHKILEAEEAMGVDELTNDCVERLARL